MVLQLPHPVTIRWVAWSPDGKTLASASVENTVKLWDPATGQLLRTLSGHSGGVAAVAWSPDGKTLASASDDDTVKLWDPATGQLLRTLSGHSSGVAAVAWSPDGKTLASASNGLHAPAYAKDDPRNSHPPDETVKLWDAVRGRLLLTFRGHSSGVSSVAWSTNGKTLASASLDQTVKLWDSTTGQLFGTLRGHSDWVHSVVWSPDGKVLASASFDSTVRVWDPANRQLLRTLTHNLSGVDSVVWNPGDAKLASGSSVYSVAWSPDGHQLASGSSDSSVVVWSAENGQVLTTSLVLPGNEWLTVRPGFLRYAASQQGDDYAVIRFGDQPPVYPLAYYRKELKAADVEEAMVSPQPEIKPKPIRLAWDTWHNRWLWIGGSAVLYCVGLGSTLSLVRRSDPARIALQFFVRAGFDKVQSIDHRRLRLTSKRDQLSADAIICDSNYPSEWLPDLEVRTYFIYKGQFSPSGAIQALRAKTRQEVIPLQSATLARAISDNDCAHKLRELEEPFVARTDPYDESLPISDPVWFYGRADLLASLPAALRQHQHAGIFGLRRVGKTSLLNQLRTQLASSCTVGIDCQGYPPTASDLLHAILTEFHRELSVQRIKNLPSSMPAGRVSNFRRNFLQLYDIWIRSGKQGPFILLLDEVDKLFPDRRMTNSENILREWVLLFRILRALSQEKKCLTVLVTAYRPHVNRQNLLSPLIGENPMHMSFKEYFLSSLNRSDTEKMVREIGAWKDIRWSDDALTKIYNLCGGHPQVTRFFASDACLQGSRKNIDEATVTETAQTIRADFHKHRIGHYYHESIWKLLQTDEQDTLRLISTNRAPDAMGELGDAITNLEKFGIVRNEEGSREIAAELFQNWLERS
ncbi:MAG TPA: AAA family ATPase [Candidatus Angelobacter sp.]|nr:AAA family ATPase [Candidatus Angelobacter sp.]